MIFLIKRVVCSAFYLPSLALPSLALGTNPVKSAGRRGLLYLSVTFFSCRFWFYSYGNFNKLHTSNTSRPCHPCVAHPSYQLGYNKDGKKAPQRTLSLSEALFERVFMLMTHPGSLLFVKICC